MYKYWSRTGELPRGEWVHHKTGENIPMIFALTSGGKVTVAGSGRGIPTLQGKIAELEHLYKKLGSFPALADWLSSQHTGYEIAEMFDGKLPGGLTKTETHMGYDFLGPKIGMFAQAVGGDESGVVKDIWFSRYWYRTSGIDKYTESKLNAPQNKTHRKMMDNTIMNAIEITEKRIGQRLTPSAVQAIFWYNEKELYKQYGVDTAAVDFFDAIKDRHARWIESGFFEEGPMNSVRVVTTVEDLIRAANHARVAEEPRQVALLYETDFNAEIDSIPLRVNQQGRPIAPNGQPSLLPERQWKVVRTSPFRAWFGDWMNDPQGSSKMVRNDGEPMILFHGTKASFDHFDISMSKPEEQAIFFTPVPEVAAEFAKEQGAALTSVEPGDQELLDLAAKYPDPEEFMKRYNDIVEENTKNAKSIPWRNSSIIPAYLNIRNLKEVQWGDYSGSEVYEVDAMNQILSDARADGADGVVIYGMSEYGKSYPQIAVFSPANIKSIYNSGRFSPADHRMLYEDDSVAYSRYFAGISIQTSVDTQGIDFVPDERKFADTAMSLKRNIVNAARVPFDRITIGLSEGWYGDVEKSFDVEFKDDKGGNMYAVGTEIFKLARAYRQDSAFVARVVEEESEIDPARHRPAIEINFKAPIARDKMGEVSETLRKYGIEFYTLIVDKVDYSEKAPVLGVRSVHMPEFWLDEVPSIEQVVADADEAEAAFIDSAEKIYNAVDLDAEVSVYWTDVETRFSHEYYGRINEAQREAGEGAIWQGRTVQEAVAAKLDREKPAGVRQVWDPRLLESRPYREFYEGSEAVTLSSGGRFKSEIRGVHYGKVDGLSVLEARYNGTGITGAEEYRLRNADERIKKRVYFYLDNNEQLPMPERGLGADVYRFHGDNFYDLDRDQEDIAWLTGMKGADANSMEVAILEAGYDGYFNGRVAVVLNQDVPVTYMGKAFNQERTVAKKLLYEMDSEDAVTGDEDVLEKAVKSGHYIAPNILRQFKGREWADLALADHAVFLDAAIAAEDASEFYQYADALAYDDPVSVEYLDAIWGEAERYRGDEVEEYPSDHESNVKPLAEKLAVSLNATKTTLDSLTTVIEDLQHEVKTYAEAHASAQVEALRMAAERGKQRVKRLREAQRLRATMHRLMRNITRKPSKSMSADSVRELLELQSQYVVSFGRNEKRMRQYLPKLIEKTTDPAKKAMLEAELAKKSLREMSLEELQLLDGQVDTIRYLGRQQEKLRRHEIKVRREEMIQGAISDLKMKNPEEALQDIGSLEQSRESRSPFYRRLLWPTLRMNRVAPKLGATWERILVDDVNELTDAKDRMVSERNARVVAAMEANGIKAADLDRQYIRKWSTIEAIGMYIAMKNPDSAAAVIHGNRVSDAQEIADGLPDNLKRFGDALMEIFGDEDFNRLADVTKADQNLILYRVQNYFPMRRVQALSGMTLKQEQVSEFLERSAKGRVTPWNKMTLRRQKISDKNQMPIRLNALYVAIDGIMRQEHYINFAEHVKDLQAVINDSRVRSAFLSSWGKEALEQVENYINDIASPDGWKARRTADTFFGKLYRNANLSVLAYSLTSFINNIPGVIAYMGDVGPYELMKETLRYTAAVPRPEARKALEKFVYDRDPQAANRVIDPTRYLLNQLGHRGFQRVQRAVGEGGFMMLEAIDKWTIVCGWRATYNQAYRQAIKTMSHEEADKAASKAARDATLRSQPTARAKDIAPIYNSDGMRWFLMFSQPVNQLWNKLVADFPRQVAQHKFDMAILNLLGIALTGVAYGFLKRKRPQEDAKELGLDAAGQFFEAVPIVGRELESMITRSARGYGYTLLPAAGQTAAAIKTLLDEEADEAAKVNAVVSMISDINRVAGLPSVQFKRVYKTFVDEELNVGVDLWQMIGGPPEEAE